jgi:hypothetical protein
MADGTCVRAPEGMGFAMRDGRDVRQLFRK